MLLYFLVILCLYATGVSQLHVHGSTFHSEAAANYTWKHREHYYFGDLQQKLNLIALQGKCASSISIQKDYSTKVPLTEAELFISSFPTSKELYNWWKSIPAPKQMRVDPYICDVVYTKKLPIFKNTGCQLAGYMSPSAPRCQTQYLKWICEQARIPINSSIPNHFVLPESDHAKNAHQPPPQPWLLTARNVSISTCGQILAPCGVVHTNANCKATAYQKEAAMFEQHCPRSILSGSQGVADGAALPTKCSPKAPFDDTIYHHDRVFIVAEVDDTYVYHTHLEIMPRIVYHLDFLKANPDIKILFGCDAKRGKAATEQGLRQGVQAITPMLQLVGLDVNRLVVHQHVHATEAYLPMEGGCQDPVYNTWQILHMRKLFLQLIGWSASKLPVKPVMLVLKRSAGSKHTRNGHDLVRQWNDDFTERLLAVLAQRFPSYRVVLYSDRNETLMRCYACQVEQFAAAKVLVGVHGAGLGNMIYMQPNSAVVELAPYGNDGRCLLGGGPFSRAAALLAHNYMMHQPPYEEFKWITKDSTSEFDIGRFVLHIESFLRSISFI